MPDCYTITRSSKIKVEEKGRSATFLNPNKVRFSKVELDGCLIQNEVTCDWLIIRNDTDNILVELKGTDVEHALEQIEAAFHYLEQNDLLGSRNAALIVCRKRHPSFNSKLQKAQDRLSRRYKAPLHVVTVNREYDVDRVMSHTGP